MSLEFRDETPPTPDFHRVAERVVQGLRDHVETDVGARNFVQRAIAQLPGLEDVLYPALAAAGLAHALPANHSRPSAVESQES